MLSEPLLKSEKEEFSRFIDKALRDLNNNQQFKEELVLQLSYEPGSESVLLENLHVVLETLQSAAAAESARLQREKAEALKLARAAGLEADKQALAAQNHDEARARAAELAREAQDDAGLLVDISEAFEQSGLIQDAIEHLEKVLEMDSQSSFLLNKLGILHRKGKNLDTSEKMFLSAQKYTPDDPYILFNKGRLYVDWQNWPQALEAAKSALSLSPDFTEATMLADYAAKRV
jgi:tetratricopeptide (TPR) repeat protein